MLHRLRLLACRLILPGLLLAATMAAPCAAQLTLVDDFVLDPAALLMPAGATYGRAINGVSFQQEPLMTYGGFQYAAWYHLGPTDENVYLARRDLSGGAWEVMDTGKTFINGDAPDWNAHNVISMGISGDGKIHLAWDHHGHTLRYMTTGAGAATGATWDSSIFGAERNSLNAGGSTISAVTYPRFVTDPNTGTMNLEYRIGSSGNGSSFLAAYDPGTGLWNSPRRYIDGTVSIFYDDPYGPSSNNRNAYLNGIDVDSSGRMHVTWTWREQATGSSNHDIMYAYSDDGGQNWHNNAGATIATPTTDITSASPGIVVVPMDRGNTLMNQQTQAVDNDGRVHVVMWHKTDEAPPVTGFTTNNTAYYHYYRHPTTGDWTRTQLPTSRAVGLRPDMAYDEHGNIYVAYVTPTTGSPNNYYTNGDLIIAAASKAAGYEDWEIVYTDTRGWVTEPLIDQQRLLTGGKVSVFAQENSPLTSATGTPLHVLEFNKLANLVVWAGDHGATWHDGPGLNWDNDNDDVGDAEFADGYRVLFDDGAASAAVNVLSPVAPASTTFRNTTAKPYAITGAGISGGGGLAVLGGGVVALANGVNDYAGDTRIENGALHLVGSASIAASPTIAVAAGAVLDASATNSGGMTLAGQTLAIDGSVFGSVVATNGSTVNLNSQTAVGGNLSVESGSMADGAGRVLGNLATVGGAVQIGGAGMPAVMESSVTLVDDFASGSLTSYTRTIVNDSNTSTNVTFSAAGGSLSATKTGTSTYEQVLLLRDDVSLVIGETLRVDLAMATTSQQMDFGLAVSATATPTASTPATPDTRTTFEWASISMRPNGDNIRVNRSVNGSIDTAGDALSGVAETNVTGLYVTRNSATQFTLGYVDAALVDNQRSVVNFTGSNVGSALGFYVDLRSVASLGSFDNLRIEGLDAPAYFGESLTIDGDATFGAGSLLLFDAYSPQAHDQLVVGGHLHLGGTLAMTLEVDAPTPQLGDAFRLFEFATAGGAFEAYQLPTLDAGLAWKVSDLAVSGELSVVANLDLDGSGLIDGGDFLALQRQNAAGIAPWQAQYGDAVVASAGAAAAAVPEPGTGLLAVLGMALGLRMRIVAPSGARGPASL